MYFEQYSPVILGILMYEAVDKIKPGKTLFPNWRHILSQNYYRNIYCSNKNLHGIVVGIMVVHLFIEFRYIGTRTCTYMDIDVASGRMTKTRRR